MSGSEPQPCDACGEPVRAVLDLSADLCEILIDPEPAEDRGLDGLLKVISVQPCHLGHVHWIVAPADWHLATKRPPHHPHVCATVPQTWIDAEELITA